MLSIFSVSDPVIHTWDTERNSTLFLSSNCSRLEEIANKIKATSLFLQRQEYMYVYGAVAAEKNNNLVYLGAVRNSEPCLKERAGVHQVDKGD